MDIIFLYFIFILIIPFSNSQTNNACNSFKGYFNIFFSPDCFHVPDNYKNAPEIIKYHIGLFEQHEVVTKDRYILGLFRIPRVNPRGVIVLHHGFTQDATCWVSQYNESVAFWFWHAGFDVWLTNSRGTVFSQRHEDLTPYDEKFWNFTFHEIGVYDLEAIISYVKLSTKVSKVILIANSMGFASSLVYTSNKVQEATESVQVVIGLAPVWYVQHAKTLTKWTIFPYAHIVYSSGVNSLIQWYSSPHYDAWWLWLVRKFNQIFPFKKLVVYFSSLCNGWSDDEQDPKFMNLMIDHYGAPTSLKNFDHLYQCMTDKNMRMYDYGISKNLDVYGNESAPLYSLENITVPILLVYSKNDYFTQADDVDALYHDLPEKTKIYGKMEIEGFSHSDFYYGRHRYDMIYKKIITFLRSYKFE